MRHILSLKEQSKKDILDILAMAQAVKKKRNAGKLTNLLPNKTLVMLFQHYLLFQIISFLCWGSLELYSLIC